LTAVPEHGSRVLLRRRDKAAVVGRSLLLQAVWNLRTMQSVGFCFALLPVLGRKRTDTDGRRAFLERHLGFFNTNPVLASYALGATARAELKASADGVREACEVKRALAGPLGMAGDSLFWATLRPFAGFLGVLAALAAKPWAAALFVVVYNVPHLALRVRGVLAGLEKGAGAVKEILGPRMRAAVTALRCTCAFVAGAVVALSLKKGPGMPAALVLAGVVFVGSFLALRVRVPVSAVGAAAIALGAAITMSGLLGG